jgi:quinol-cytochrome oxidoreductase complex cytochrome b subunit
VILYGAYNYPREVTWVTGVVLLLVSIGFGFTATYAIPDKTPPGSYTVKAIE